MIRITKAHGHHDDGPGHWPGVLGRRGRGRAEGRRQGAGFSLQGSDGKTYTLEQFKGKSAVVIAWFPKAFTGGCTNECKSLRANSKALKDLNVAYFTASVDTPEENKKFAESLDLDYPILSDPDKTVAKAYGVVHAGRGVRQSLDVLHRQGRDHQGDRQEGQGRQGRRRTSPPRSRSWAWKGSDACGRESTGDRTNHERHEYARRSVQASGDGGATQRGGPTIAIADFMVEFVLFVVPVS